MKKKKTDQEITDEAAADAMNYGAKSAKPKIAVGMKNPDYTDTDNDGDMGDDTDDDGDGPDDENF